MTRYPWQYTIYLFLVTIVTLAFVLTAGAETSGDVLENPTENYYLSFSDPAPVQFPSIQEAALKMVVSLGIVLALLVGTLWLLKRFLPGGMPIRDQKFKLVRIIERVPIAPRQTLYLLWVIDRVIVVASNQGQLSTLSEIRDQSVIQQNMPPEFTDILNKANLDMSEVYKV